MYKLISPSNYFVEDILPVVCRNRKVDINLIKNPSAESIISYTLLDKIDKAVAVFLHFNELAKTQSIKIGLIVDSDMDGYTSFTVAYRYLEKNMPDFELVYFVHSGKQHGVTDEAYEWAIEEDLNILLVPDAGSADFDNHTKLRNAEIITVILDHHDTPHDSEDAIVVNSQLSEGYTNKQFSGVGIVYKFIQALDEALGIEDADNYLDLVAVGNVADAMLMTEPETRYYVYEGIGNLQNEVLKEMIFQFIGKWEKVNPHSLAFNVVPKVNGTIRAGSMEEKIDLLEAFIGHGLEDIHENPKARTEANKQETFLKKAVRQAKNAHARQNTSKKKWIAKIKDKIVEQGQENNHIIIVTLNKKDKFDNNLTGVIAGDLAGYYKRPVLILSENAETGLCTGSMRGYDRFSMHTKELLLQTGTFEWVNGHENAAGCCIHKDNIPHVNSGVEKFLTFEVTEDSPDLVEVDFAFKSKEIGRFVVENVHKYEKYWGKGIEPPLFAVSELEIPSNKIGISSGGKFSAEVNGVHYVQFSVDPELEQYKDTHNNLTLTVVGSMGLNEYMGKTTHQFIIKAFTVDKVEENVGMKPKFIF